MAVEDAAVLGALFSHLTHRGQISSFLAAYQELRESRCARTRAPDLGDAHIFVFPLGSPAAQARDEFMRSRGREDADMWDEGALKAQFEQLAEIFLYDAHDAAEEWWLNWGRFGEDAREMPLEMSAFDFATVTVACT